MHHCICKAKTTHQCSTVNFCSPQKPWK